MSKMDVRIIKYVRYYCRLVYRTCFYRMYVETSVADILGRHGISIAAFARQRARSWIGVGMVRHSGVFSPDRHQFLCRLFQCLRNAAQKNDHELGKKVIWQTDSMPAMRPHPVNTQSMPCRPKRRCDSEGISDNERTAVAQRKQHPEKIFQKFENKVIEQTELNAYNFAQIQSETFPCRVVRLEDAECGGSSGWENAPKGVILEATCSTCHAENNGWAHHHLTRKIGTIKCQYNIAKISQTSRSHQTTGKSRSSIYSSIQKGLFPAPLKIGQKAIAWSTESIRQWQESCLTAMNQ